MKIKPVLTEKTMEEAKRGQYTFLVPGDLTKHQIKDLVGKAFGVTVKSVRTQNKKGRVKSTLTRRKVTVKSTKKAIVALSGKQKIDVFEGETK